MVIPEKYRDRYDALARTHPWMREMRDEWKAKAEGREASKHRKMTNLDWLCDNDRGAIHDALTCNMRLCEECRWWNYSRFFEPRACANEGAQDWLEADHVSEERDESYTASDGGEENPSSQDTADAWDVSSVWSKVTCAENGEGSEPDTREKLEEDIVHWCHTHGVPARQVFEWLDRQAVITASEFVHRVKNLEALRDELAEKARRVDEADSRWEGMRRDLEEMKAERDYYRDKCGRMLDAIHEAERVMES